jgi:hypothetical protein
VVSASSCHQPDDDRAPGRQQDVAEGDRPRVAQIVGVTRDVCRESEWDALQGLEAASARQAGELLVGLWARLPVADATRCRANARLIGWDSLHLEAISHGTGHATD